MALADIMQLTFVQRYGSGGEKLLTNWFFLKNLGATNAEQLYDEFTADGAYVEKINQLQAQQIKNDSIRIINLGDPTDFYEAPVADGGNNGSACMPAYVALNFTKKLNTRAIRPGSVRIPGIDETYVANGVVNDATYIATIEDSRLAFSTALPFGGAASWQPIVVKRVKETTVVGGVSINTYRLPETDEEAIVGLVTACIVNNHVSHQVSRGNGR
jgi:hypothetical protein